MIDGLLRGIGRLDHYFLQLFYSARTSFLDGFFSAVTWLGSLWVLIPLWIAFTVYIFRVGGHTLLVPLCVGFIGAISTTYVLKFILDRTRPALYESLSRMPNDPSFPSAHTTQVFIFVFLIIISLFFMQSGYRVLFLALGLVVALLVAFSRIYLQVHYFSDVIAGVFVATLWALVAYFWIYR